MMYVYKFGYEPRYTLAEGYLGLPTTVLGRPQTRIPNPIPNPSLIPIPNTNPGTSQNTLRQSWIV